MNARIVIKRLTLGIGIIAVSLVLLLMVVSLVVRQIAVHRAERDFPAPGRLVDFDGATSHINCVGTGSPTIVLESGLDDQGSSGWAGIQRDLAEFSRVCSYDRAGFLWSEPREEPRDAERIGRELHTLLAAASEAPPYVMVAHSNAGLLVRVFDALFPGEVGGFVFVDASHPEQDRALPLEIRTQIEQRKAEPDHRWFFRVLAPYRIFAPERTTPRTAYWWRSLPDGVMAEARSIDAMSAQAGRTGSLGERPVAVLSASVTRPLPGVSDEGIAAMQRVWLDLHAELAALSTNSDHRIVDGASHYIHKDQPASVVAAIRDVVTAVREEGTVRRETAEVKR